MKVFRFHSLVLALDHGGLRVSRDARGFVPKARFGRSKLSAQESEFLSALLRSERRMLELGDLRKTLNRWPGDANGALVAARVAASRINKKLSLIAGRDLPLLVTSEGTNKDAGFRLNEDLVEAAPSATVREGVSAPFDDVLAEFDRSRDPRHFHMFQHETVTIEKTFVEPAFHVHAADQPHEQVGGAFVESARRALDEDRVLFVIGPYGCGKTVLLKHLQQTMEKEGESTVFLLCHELVDVDRQALRRAIAQRTSRSDLTVFLDDFNAVCSVDSEPSKGERKFLSKIFGLLSVPGVRLVVSSRALPEENTPSRMYMLTLFGVPLADHGVVNFRLFDVQYFSWEQKKAWLEAFSGALEDARASALPLRYEDTPKELRPACQNPLFLYMLALRHRLDGGFVGVPNLFSLYEAFLDRTALGKFSRPNMVEAAVEIMAFKSVYRSFLCEVALLIDGTVRERSLAPGGGFVADENRRNPYWVTSRQLRRLIDDFSARPGTPGGHLINRERVFSGLLSCYFFEQVGSRWFFRDNNTFFFLLAESIWAALEQVMEEYESRGGVDEEVLGRAARVNLMPATVDLLWERIASKGAGYAKVIAALFSELVRKGKLLSGASQERSSAETRLDVLALVLLLRTRKESYSSLPQVPGALPGLLKRLQTEDVGQFDAVRRAFMGAYLEDWTFRDSDLSGFNFQGSTLCDVCFDRCVARELEWVGTTLDGVEFIRCAALRLTLREVTGELSLIECQVSLLDVHDTCEVDVTLDDSVTTVATIRGGHHPSKTRIAFEVRGGSLNALKIHGVRRSSAGRHPRVVVDDAQVQSVSLQNTAVVIQSNVELPSFVQEGSVEVRRSGAKFFLTRKDQGHRWGFVFCDAGDDVVLTSGDYRTQELAQGAIHDLRVNLEVNQQYDIAHTDAGSYFWIRSGRGTMLAQSEEYARPSELEAAKRFVRREAPRAPVDGIREDC